MTLGGLTHALTPLAAANPLVHVVGAPALFLDALWLPFRRDHRELQAAVAQAGPVSAVFGHADVVRFLVPCTMCRRGLLELCLGMLVL